MKELLKDAVIGMPVGLYIILLIAAALMIAGFCLPPLAVIDASVLKGVSILILGGWLYYVTTHIPNIIENGAKIRASKGDAIIEISKSENGNDTDADNDIHS